MARTGKEYSAGKPLIIKDLVATVADPLLQWEPFREHIEIHRLYSVPGGASAAFLRYAPGASLYRHQHLGYEHIYVIRGSQTDDNGRHDAGTLVINPPGSSHTVTSREGCTVLAIWERAVVGVQVQPGQLDEIPVK